MEVKQKIKKQKNTIRLSEHERIVKILHEEILRKDKQIEALKLENQMIMKTALKRSEILNDLQKKSIEQIQNHNKTLNRKA